MFKSKTLLLTLSVALSLEVIRTCFTNFKNFIHVS